MCICLKYKILPQEYIIKIYFLKQHIIFPQENKIKIRRMDIVHLKLNNIHYCLQNQKIKIRKSMNKVHRLVLTETKINKIKAKKQKILKYKKKLNKVI